MFTEADSKAQDAVIEELKAEFKSLAEQEEKLRAAVAASGEPAFGSNENIPPEVAKMLEEEKEKAKREGARRVAEFQSRRSGAQGVIPGRGRQGVIRI
ncbi:MAG: hypothetical protein IJU76_10870 [Desulfovibrionaceae bacterium]|nr:hypothetical protein [Desulfovibrionaceae bacterium]